VVPDKPDSPDPIRSPLEYQQHLLALLGDDDPAEVQARTPQVMWDLAREAGPDLRTPPAAGEWSVFGCIAHLTDAELVMSARYRWILAHDQPPLLGYDQDLWVDRVHHESESVAFLLGYFEPLRMANLALWERSGSDDRARVGMHSERGPESYDLCFRMIAGHDRFHLNQARRALTAARRR
jgi:hypothetical protein